MAAGILHSLTSTLRYLDLPDPVRVARHLATILGPQVYEALNGTKSVRSSEPLPEAPAVEPWDPNLTLLALASRASPHPLRAWLDCAIGQGILDDEEANTVEKALRHRFAPEGTAPTVFTQVLAEPFTDISKFATQALVADDDASKSPRLPQVCIQCRKDHQRCERRGEKPCKRCADHGWNCAFFSSSKRGRGADKAWKRRRLELAVVEIEEEAGEGETRVIGSDEEGEEPAIKPLPNKPKRKASQPSRRCKQCADAHTKCEIKAIGAACERCLADRNACSFVPIKSRSATPISRSAISTAKDHEGHVTGHARAASREIDNLNKGFAISRTKAVDDALAELGMRKTPANVAFLREAGLISDSGARVNPVQEIKEEEGSEDEADEGGDEMEADELPPSKEHDHSPHSASRAEGSTKRKTSAPTEEDDEDDAASRDGSASEFSFFAADTAAGTPATVTEPHFASDQHHLVPSAGSSSSGGCGGHKQSFSATVDLPTRPLPVADKPIEM